MPRTPKPVAPPTTLTEAVLDLERRMTGGDALSEVLLPDEDWTRLVELAEEEVDAGPGAELLELRRLREDLREFLAMGPAATPLALMNELDKTIARAREGWAPKPAESFDPLPPAKPKRQRKAKKVECEHCGDAHESDICGLKPSEEPEGEEKQHRMHIEDIEEEAA